MTTWTRTDHALTTQIGSREYIILRRDIQKGIRYMAWSDMAGVFAERGPILPSDTDSRKLAISELQFECESDYERG